VIGAVRCSARKTSSASSINQQRVYSNTEMSVKANELVPCGYFDAAVNRKIGRDVHIDLTEFTVPVIHVCSQAVVAAADNFVTC